MSHNKTVLEDIGLLMPWVKKIKHSTIRTSSTVVNCEGGSVIVWLFLLLWNNLLKETIISSSIINYQVCFKTFLHFYKKNLITILKYQTYFSFLIELSVSFFSDPLLIKFWVNTAGATLISPSCVLTKIRTQFTVSDVLASRSKHCSRRSNQPITAK